VLDGADPITCRPADVLEAELSVLEEDLSKTAAEKNISLADNKIDDVLTYALFPQVGLKFLENRNNPDAFEPAPGAEPEAPAVVAAPSSQEGAEAYSVRVDGKVYRVEVAPDGTLTDIAVAGAAPAAASAPVAAPAASGGEPLNSPLAGNIVKVNVSAGQQVNEGDVVILMEAMKMETEVRAAKSGTVASVAIKEGDAVQAGQPLMTIA
jgi:oxaloacetate decarboxylase alpha subunit